MSQNFSERPVEERVIGILSVIKEPLSAEAVAKYAQTTAEEVRRISEDASKGVEVAGADEKLYVANEATRALQGDLKWAHTAIAQSALSRIPGFKPRYEGR